MRKTAKAASLIQKNKVGRSDEEVTHLQYADDIISENAEEKLINLTIMLRLLEAVTGLKINFHKSEMVSITINDNRNEHTGRILDVKRGSFHIKYLGLPPSDGSIRAAGGNGVIKKLRDRIASWKRRLLSTGER